MTSMKQILFHSSTSNQHRYAAENPRFHSSRIPASNYTLLEARYQQTDIEQINADKLSCVSGLFP